MDKQEIAKTIKIALWKVGVDTKSIIINKDSVVIKGELYEAIVETETTKEMDIERIPVVGVT